MTTPFSATPGRNAPLRRTAATALLASLSAAAIGLLTPSPSQANNGFSGDAAQNTAQWGLGLGASIERKPYRGIGNDSQALPLLYYENRWLRVFGPGVDLKLPSAGPVSFRLLGRYGGQSYEAKDSPFLTGMQERKASVWLGGGATWRSTLADVSGELLGDASGESKGLQFRLAVERRFQSGAFDFTPRLAAHWLDSKYVSHYYGVTASEAQAGRPAYEGGSTVNLEAGLRVGYALAPRQSVFVDLSATTLGSSIEDSPLVDRSRQTGLRLGYLYRF